MSAPPDLSPVVQSSSSDVSVHSIWSLFQRGYLRDLHDPATDIPIEAIVEAVSPPCHVLFQDNPVSPFNNVARRRYRGFGKRSTNRSTTHDTPSPFWLMHKAWDFLEPTDREGMCKTHPHMIRYAALRVEAFHSALCDSRHFETTKAPPGRGATAGPNPSQAHGRRVALLRF